MMRVQQISDAFARLGLAATLAAAPMSAPVSAQQKVTYSTSVAPRFPAVSAMRSLGVLPFNGKDGENFTASLAAKLQAANLDGTPIFDLRTMNSLNFRSDAVISRAEMTNAIRNGQKLGVKLVFTGVVTEASVRSTPFNKQVTRCEGGGSASKCYNRTYTVACKRITGQYSVTPQAIRVDTGAVLFSEVVSRNGEFEQCEDGGVGAVDFVGMLFGRKDAVEKTTATTPEALLMDLRDKAAQDTTRLVAPYKIAIEVRVKNSADGLSKPDTQTFNNAVAFA